MEKLSRFKLTVFILALLSFNNLIGQDNFCLIEVKGMPQIEVKEEYRTAKKGDVLDGKHKIQLRANEAIKLIDGTGNLYEVKEVGSFGIDKVIASKVENTKVSVTKKYFTYLYKKMFTQHQNNSKAGVVYRLNPSGTLLFPENKRRIAKDTIRFEWTNEVFQPLTFSLVNLDTKRGFKITTNGNYVTLPVDGMTLQEGGNYQWTILAEGDLKPVYHNFSILKKADVTLLDPKVTVFKKELLELGFDKKKINALISDHFNIQY